MTGFPDKIGKYEVLAELGRGAMGAVYRARDPQLERVVALKTMAESLLVEEEMRERFLREARSAAKLQHVNIVTIYELGEVEGRPYIAMELLEGESLAEMMKAGPVGQLQDKIALVQQICTGLDFAHKRGVIHRDVKPGNIQVLPDGTVKIMDFGIALHQQATMLTRTGVVLGTPNYMAPEQITGSQVDHRADMWAVGVILYELLVDKLPFDSDTLPNLIYRIVHEPLPPLHAGRLSLPPQLVEVVDRALQKDPNERYADLAEMAAALREVPGGRKPAAAVAADEGTVRIDTPPETKPDSTPIEVKDLMEGVDEAIQQGRREEALRRLDQVLEITPGFGRARDLRHALRQRAGASQPAVQAPAGPSVALPSSFREEATFGEPLGTKVIALTPAEDLLAVGGVDGSVRLWDLANRRKLQILRSSVHQRAGHEGLVTSIAFSPDGSLLASGHVDGAIHLWRLEGPEEIQVKLGHDAAVRGVAFSPDGATLASGGLDATVKLWERESLEAQDARRRLIRQPADVTSLAWLHQGFRLAVGLGNSLIRVLDSDSGRLTATLRGHGAAVTFLSVAPDGNLLLGGGQDQTVRLFDVERSNRVGDLQGHERSLSSIAVFPDGKRAVSAAAESRIIVWDLPRAEALTTLWGTGDETFVSLQVFDEGRRVASALSDGRIRLWTGQ